MGENEATTPPPLCRTAIRPKHAVAAPAAWRAYGKSRRFQEASLPKVSGHELDRARPQTHEFRFHEIVSRKSEITVDPSGKSVAVIRPARASEKGTLAHRHGTLARVAMDAAASARCKPRRRNACSVRRSRVVLAPRPWRLSAPPCGRCGNGDKKGRSPGRARISRKTIARGKPGCLGCTCQIRVRSLLPLHTVLRAQSAPGFPCALCQREGQRDVTTRAKTCRGNAVGCLKIESANARSSRPSEARAGTHNHRTRSCEGWDPQPALAT